MLTYLNVEQDNYYDVEGSKTVQEKGVTMLDVLHDEQELEEDANVRKIKMLSHTALVGRGVQIFPLSYSINFYYAIFEMHRKHLFCYHIYMDH